MARRTATEESGKQVKTMITKWIIQQGFMKAYGMSGRGRVVMKMSS
jgi:hypothetical protein